MSYDEVEIGEQGAVAVPGGKAAGDESAHDVCDATGWASSSPEGFGWAGSVPAVRALERPGAAGGRVASLDVAERPRDLGRGVRLPVGTGRGHLAAGQCLRDAVRPRARVRRRDAPLRLVHDDVVEALELGVTPAVRVGHELARDLTGIGRRRVVALRLPLLLRLHFTGGLADGVGLCAQLC